MIYTTYFAQLKSLPQDVIPISICGKAPDWYDGIQYKKLAPRYDFFVKWKENHDNDYYIRCFNEQVLSKLNPSQVIDELRGLVSHIVIDPKLFPIRGTLEPHIALVCYEKPEDFCHRHLVAEWLSTAGYKCSEWHK